MTYKMNFQCDFSTLQRVSENENALKALEGLLFHGVSFSCNNEAVLVVGESGVGKSTLLKKLIDRVSVIHEDRSFIFSKNSSNRRWKVRAAVMNKAGMKREIRYLADYTAKVDLKKIFLLSKSFNASSSVTKETDPAACWKIVIKNSARPVTDNTLYKNYYKLVDIIAEDLPFFHLAHNLDDSSDKLMEMIFS
ncbi:MAG: hypothetical protein R6W70_10675 [bacterium]